MIKLHLPFVSTLIRYFCVFRSFVSHKLYLYFGFSFRSRKSKSSRHTPLVQSGTKDTSRGADYVITNFNKYNVKSYAVLIDHTTLINDIPNLPDHDLCGFFTFDINLTDETFKDHPINLITINGPVPNCDGWLIVSTSRAAVFALNQALLLSGNEHQIITRLYEGQVSKMDGYMDIFSGQTETLMYIHHYLYRKYNTVFPIDVRYTVHDCDGTIRHAGQRIIKPNALTVLDSRDMNLGEFSGYLWLSLELENLQTRIPPFFHFYADYFNDTGIFSNHQSGLSTKRPNAVFNRAFMPTDSNQELTSSFYNANNIAVQPQAMLHFNMNGQEKTVKRLVEPIKPKHMSYQNISKIFEDVSFDDVNSAFVLFSCDQPIHRPNLYVHPKGTMQYFNLNHQTVGRACYLTEPVKTFGGNALKKLKQFNAYPCMLSIPILDERFKIDTYFGLLSSTICSISDFTFIIRNDKGDTLFSRDEKVDGRSPEFLNLNEYVRQHGVSIHSGTFSIVPQEGLDIVPYEFTSLLGFKHRDFDHICFHPDDTHCHTNLPFYIGADRPHPPPIRYKYSPLQTTDKLGRGVISDELDTLCVVGNWSLQKDYSKTCEYELEIIDASGKAYSFLRTIPPQSYDACWLSELLSEANIVFESPYCSLWTKSVDTFLVSYHLLYRKKDHALTVVDTFECAFHESIPDV